MKTYIVLSLALMLVMPLIGSAQKVHLGPDVGLNAIHIQNTGSGSTFQMGVQGGMLFSYTVNEHFSLTSGLYLSQKKVQYDTMTAVPLLEQFAGILDLVGIGGVGGLNIDGIKLDIVEEVEGISSNYFVEIPVLANYHIHDVHFMLGPTIGIRAGTRNKEQITTEIPILKVVDLATLDSTGGLAFFLPPAEEMTTSTNNFAENYRRFDFGATVGVGYTTGPVRLNLAYNQSFLDYRKSRGEDKAKLNKALRFSIAYMFAVKGAGL